MRLGVHGPAADRAKLEALIASETATLLELIEPHVVGRGNIDIAGAVLQLLEAQGQSVSTAESCTGGAVAQMLTAVPGASASYLGSVVAYDNRVKREVLGVPESALQIAWCGERGGGAGHGGRGEATAWDDLGCGDLRGGWAQWRDGRQARGHGLDGRGGSARLQGMGAPLWIAARPHRPTRLPSDFDPLASRSQESGRFGVGGMTKKLFLCSPKF